MSKRATTLTYPTMAVAVLAMAVAVGPATAQTASPAASVAGVVVDGATGSPLSDALVTLSPVPGGLMVVSGRGMYTAGRSSETGPDGGYRFADVTPGRYRLRIERLGYRAATMEVEVRRPVEARVSVGLDLEPVALEPVLVEQESLPEFVRVRGEASEPEAARRVFERERQSVFLAGDARALTYADVVESVTLGETDVFRALQRFPGVATRDDYTAELWTRGAPWSQTRVTFDGLPLFNPVHAVGVFSGITPDILGAVFHHPGYRSVASGEGAAGVVDLRSRPGGGDGGVRGSVDVSMASAKVALDQRLGDRASWIVSARRSYLGVLAGGLDWLELEHADLPYEFHDVAGRFDVRLGERSALEVSGLWEDDRLSGDIEGILEGTTANWGNAAARVTLHSPLGRLAARYTLGVSRYRSHIQESGDSLSPSRPVPWSEPPADNRVVHVRLASELEPRTDAGRPPSWTAGYEVVIQEAFYDGPEPRYHPVRPDTSERVLREDRLWNFGGWFEKRFEMGRLSVQPGIRVEYGSGIADIEEIVLSRPTTPGPVRELHVAPRVAARLTVTPDLSLSAAFSRSWQYLQAIALAGPSAHPAFHASQFWLLAGDRAPAIRADIVTVGAEQWLGDGWLASLNGWARRSTGLALPDPRPGPLEGRALFVVGSNDARGVEAAARRVSGRMTASFSYSYGESAIDAAGLTYAAQTDRRHRVDATGAVRVGGGLRVGAAYTAMSGSPYTRVMARLRSSDCELFGFGCSQSAASIEQPNSRRTQDYRSLDAIAMLTRPLGGIEATVYVQIRNVLGRDNAVTYSGSNYETVYADRNPRSVDELIWYDRFEAGLPRLPLVGARITF
jgi:hypothetical protein